ncbi:MAG: ATP-binding protein [Kofleriaceae bacterium]
MARLSGVPEASYAALDQIRTITLITFGSLFTPDQPIWSLANLERLHTRFIDRFDDDGEGDFFSKLRTQLDGATSAELQLAAELLYVQQFFTAQTVPEKKIQNVREVLGWSNQPVDIPGWAIDGMQTGLAGDQSFNQHRPYHLAWLIEFLLAWHRSSRDRGELLSDPWQFREFVQEVEGSRGAHQPMREAWMYMIFPASFEAISSRSDKIDVREAFLDLLGHPPSDNIDADLLDIRRALTRDAGDDFHLYQGEVAQRWRPTSADSGPLPEVPRDLLVDAIRHFDSEQRQRPEWAAWESNGAYKFALEFEGNLYPPKEIVALATRRLKSSFGGGEQTNKYLTKHGFSVQRLCRSADGTEEADDEKEEFTLAEAAEHILATRREPISLETLWNEIEKQGLFKSSHSDPYRSLYSVLYRASVHNRRAGSPRHRPFVRVAPSVFGLTALGHVGDPNAQEERAPTARAATKREIVELFKRDELQQIADYYSLEVDDRRVNEQLVDAVVRSKKARIAEILSWVSRDRLKDICFGLELDSTGREKALLVERILGESSAPTEVDERPTGPTGESASAALARLLPGALNLTAPGEGWPSLGRLTLADGSYDVSAYVRLIGGSSRGNALERRFQNPSQQSPIVDDPERYELLLGIWTEQGDERAVIVAFDPYRRMERNTRFSLFMPLALLEQAADTGFATHENNKGETLYAFRPENIGRYVQVQIEDGTWQINRERDAKDAPKSNESPKAPKADTKRRSSPKVPAPSLSRSAPTGRESSIYIRPQVAMYSAFARLNYKPWFALAEFVDNSIQSFLHNRHRLEGDGHEGPLVIDINIDDNELSVTDRAGGIAWPDFPRAFSPASPPEDATGLSEFGLGMKAAACWFSKRWHVRTSALGEPVERTVTFDIPRIAREGIEDLPIETRPSRDSDHFTVITMRDLRVHPRSRTLTKIREHLSSIYRVLTKDGVVRLRLTSGGRTEELVYEHPELLVAPHHRSPLGPVTLWRQDFVVDLGDRKVTGWAGIMKSGSHSRAGFSVFRRRRLIEGSVGETYKPSLIFGSPNSFASQRVVGEMFVEGFDVTHTKDGIQWHGYEDEVLESIRRQLDSYRMPLLDQAEGYRARKVAASLPKDFGAEAVTATIEALSTPAAANALHVEAIPEPNGTGSEPEPSQTPPPVLQHRVIKIPIERDGRSWDVHLKLVHDRALPFYRTSFVNEDGREVVAVELNLDHEFSIGHINDNESALQPVLRLVASLALAEKVARDAGVKNAGVIRQYTNDILEAIAAVRPTHRP